jgi:hypothetical protein
MITALNPDGVLANGIAAQTERAIGTSMRCWPTPA